MRKKKIIAISILALLSYIAIHFLKMKKEINKAKNNTRSFKDRTISSSLSYTIDSVAMKYYMTPYIPIIESIIMVESGADPSLIGKSGERGLMQIMPAAMQDVNKKYNTNFIHNELNAVLPNLNCGILYFKLLCEQNKWRLGNSIRSYNAGFTGANVFQRGFNYLEKVISFLTNDEILMYPTI